MPRFRLCIWLLLAGCTTPITDTAGCLTNSQCPSTQSCVDGACVDQCFLDRECDPGQRCEFNRCVSPLPDARPQPADAARDAAPTDGTMPSDAAAMRR